MRLTFRWPTLLSGNWLIISLGISLSRTYCTTWAQYEHLIHIWFTTTFPWANRGWGTQNQVRKTRYVVFVCWALLWCFNWLFRPFWWFFPGDFLNWLSIKPETFNCNILVWVLYCRLRYVFKLWLSSVFDVWIVIEKAVLQIIWRLWRFFFNRCRVFKYFNFHHIFHFPSHLYLLLTLLFLS